MSVRSESQRAGRAAWAAGAVLASALASAPAYAQAPAPPEAPPSPTYSAFTQAPSQRMWFVEGSYRGNFVTNPGFNPFSDDDYLGQFSATASRTVYVHGPLSLALGLGWDYGKTSSTARGDATSLEVQRLLAPIEGRLHFGRWGYALLRAAPGVAIENASLTDATAPASLTKSRWLFAADLSGGYAFPIIPHTGQSAASPSIWLETDGGYGWVAAQRLDLSTTTPSNAVAVADGIDLGTLTMQGAFFRVGMGFGF